MLLNKAFEISCETIFFCSTQWKIGDQYLPTEKMKAAIKHKTANVGRIALEQFNSASAA